MGNFRSGHLSWHQSLASRYIFVNKAAIFVEFCARISDDHLFFSGSISPNYFVGNFTVLDDAVWSFNKAVVINACINCKVKHKTHVATFWRFYSTNTTIVCRVSITNFKAGAFTSKTTRAHT